MSLADCCGCRSRINDNLRTGAMDRVEPFKLGIRDLSDLNVHGNDEESREMLAEAGGAEGLCVALNSDPVKGIIGTPGA